MSEIRVARSAWPVLRHADAARDALSHALARPRHDLEAERSAREAGEGEADRRRAAPRQSQGRRAWDRDAERRAPAVDRLDDPPAALAARQLVPEPDAVDGRGP